MLVGLKLLVYCLAYEAGESMDEYNHVMRDTLLCCLLLLSGICQTRSFSEHKGLPNLLEFRAIFKVGSEVATSKSCSTEIVN